MLNQSTYLFPKSFINLSQMDLNDNSLIPKFVQRAVQGVWFGPLIVRWLWRVWIFSFISSCTSVPFIIELGIVIGGLVLHVERVYFSVFCLVIAGAPVPITIRHQHYAKFLTLPCHSSTVLVCFRLLKLVVMLLDAGRSHALTARMFVISKKIEHLRNHIQSRRCIVEPFECTFKRHDRKFRVLSNPFRGYWVDRLLVWVSVNLIKKWFC